MHFLRSGLLLLTLLAGARSGPGQGLPAPLAGTLPLDPAVRVGHLPNGLTYYIRHNATPAHQARLLLLNHAGSLLEEEDQRGLAHFLEHLAFQGTRDYPRHELVNTLQRAGVRFGADLNAYTTATETVYELPLPTDKPELLRQGVNILANWAGYLRLDSAAMQAERGVILEEARQRGFSASERLRQQTAPVLLGGGRQALREPIGLEQVIRTAPVARVRQFYHDWYRPDLQAVVAVGDFDADQMEGYIRENFGPLPAAGPTARPLPSYPLPAVPGTRVLLLTDPSLTVTQASSVARQPAAPPTEAGYATRLNQQLFSAILGERLGQLRRQAQPPFQAAAVSFNQLSDDTDAGQVQVQVAHPSEAPAALAAVLGQLELVRRTGVTPAELSRARTAMLAGLERQWQERDKVSSNAYATEYSQLFLHGVPSPGLAWERAATARHLAAVTPADFSPLAAGLLQPASRVIILQAPRADQAQLPDSATLQRWFMPPAAPVALLAAADSGAARRPLAVVPAGGRIVAEQRWPALGLTELRLGNGVRVLLKPTQLQNNEVLLGSFAFGGTSLAPDSAFLAAALSGALTTASGPNGWPRAALQARLNGSGVQLAPDVAELTQGVQGHCPPAELETALQLAYLYYTQPPRHDTLAWSGLQRQVLASLAARPDEASRAFRDTVVAVLNGYSPRRLSPTAAQVRAATQAQAERFFRARFGNAAGTTFVLVGNLDSATVRPLLARYLGALPAQPGPAPTYRDLHLPTPRTPQTRVLRRGHDDKALVQLVFQGPARYSASDELVLRALRDVLSLRLLARLREQERGVYSPSVQASMNKLPRGTYRVTVAFSCAPANTEHLIEATMAEIKTLAANGPTPDDWAKVQAEQQAEQARLGSSNVDWLAYLLRQKQLDQPLTDRLSQPRRLAALRPTELQRAARRYLAPNRLLRFELQPVAPDATGKKD